MSMPTDVPLTSLSPFVMTTEIAGLLVYERPTFPDPRGFFREAMEKRDIEAALGRPLDIVQWNHSRSLPGVVRGFHAEPWEKLIYVPHGEVMAAIADLRPESPTFGKVVTLTLGASHRRTLFLPVGMGNSFCVTGAEPADYLYLVTAYYEGKPTSAVSLFDPLLVRQFGGWPVAQPLISEKDQQHPTLKEQFGAQVDFTRFPWLQES